MADKDFNLYTVRDRVCSVYHPEGNKIAAEDGFGEGGSVTLTAFPDGTVGVFRGFDSFKGGGIVTSGKLYKPDLQGGESILLAERKENTYFLTCFDEDTLLYADEKGIYRSDYDLQNAEALYLWENHGLNVSDVSRMSAEPDGSIDVIIRAAEGRQYYLHLNPTPEGIETMEIKFAVSKWNRQQYLESVYRFNREHPAYLITMEVYEEEAKLLTELTAGKGPVLVDTDVIAFTANKKLWEPMDDKLAEWGLQEQLLEKPLLGGQIDGEQYGMVFAWDMYSFLTNCYEAESWDYEAFMAYVRENGIQEKIYPEQDPQSFLKLFFLRSLEDSYFVDAAEGRAHFDSEEFAEAAGMAKELVGEDRPINMSSIIPKIRSGKYLGDIAYLNSIERIVYYWEIYGKDVNFVGFPGREGSCHFIRTREPVAVRRSASEEEKQAAFWFLSEMLGKEAQQSVGGGLYSVRKDVFEEQLEEPKDAGGYLIGGETVTVSGDWAAAKEELLSIYEKSVPVPAMPKSMDAVIFEELAGYFDEAKSMEDAAEIIQNRVQLYLDERN